MIQPFKWPFIVIPNLPIDLISMLESPVPYIIGILANDSIIKKITSNNCINGNIVLSQNKNFKFIEKEKIDYSEPYFKNLKDIMKKNNDSGNYYLKVKNYEEYSKYCEINYKHLYEILKYDVADPLTKIVFDYYTVFTYLNRILT